MCAALLGVHGIGQHKTTSVALEEAWRSAAMRGIALNSDEVKQPPTLDVAFYGNLFNRTDGRLGSTSEGMDPLSADEELFIQDVLDSSVLDGVEVDESAARELGIPAVPGRLGRLLVRVDRRFGRNAGKYMLVILRQVYRYLTDEELSQSIRMTVAGAIKSDTSVLLAHSLGSVVVYDMALRGDLSLPLDTKRGHRSIVTFGSPLSWPTVLRMLGHGTDIHDTQCAWRNLYDATDVVTGGQGIGSTKILNRRVKNSAKDPHAAVAYLRQPAMGRLLTSHAGM